MKYIRYSLLACAFLTTASDICREKKPKQIDPNKPACSRQEIAQAVLAGTAHVLTNVGNIVQDPHNHNNVGASVANMIAGIINITVATLQNRSIDIDDEEALRQHLMQMYQPLCEHLTEIIITKRLPSEIMDDDDNNAKLYN